MCGADLEMRSYPEMPVLITATSAPQASSFTSLSSIHRLSCVHLPHVRAEQEIACSAHKDILDVRAADP